jgi:hypothetical protein
MNIRPAIVLQSKNSLSRSNGQQLNEGEFEVHPHALENMFLIHTRNGKPFSSSGVKRCLSRFLGEVVRRFPGYRLIDSGFQGESSYLLSVIRRSQRVRGFIEPIGVWKE